MTRGKLCVRPNWAKAGAAPVAAMASDRVTVANATRLKLILDMAILLCVSVVC
jgi:hypothetical protein